MSVTTQPERMTAAEFLAKYGHCSGVELVRGRVVWPGRDEPRTGGVIVPHFRHGRVCRRTAQLIGEFVDAHALGWVATNDTFIPITPEGDTLRGADVLFVSYARVPKEQDPDNLTVAPELAIEVLSPSDRTGEVFTQIGEYLAAGVVAVVVLNPKLEAATIYRGSLDEFPQTLHNGDEFALPDILPGFRVPVKRFFEA